MRLRDPADDSGTALVEFFWLGILLLVPLTYAILFAFQLQRAAFALTEATRSAGRAFVTTASLDENEARSRAFAAAALTMKDHHVPFAAPQLDVTCTGSCFVAGGSVRVSMHVDVQLPLLALVGLDGGTVGVDGAHDEIFDRYVDTTAGS